MSGWRIQFVCTIVTVSLLGCASFAEALTESSGEYGAVFEQVLAEHLTEKTSIPGHFSSDFELTRLRRKNFIRSNLRKGLRRSFRKRARNRLLKRRKRLSRPRIQNSVSRALREKRRKLKNRREFRKELRDAFNRRRDNVIRRRRH